jgi:hypothetical protein
MAKTTTVEPTKMSDAHWRDLNDNFRALEQTPRRITFSEGRSAIAPDTLQIMTTAQLAHRQATRDHQTARAREYRDPYRAAITNNPPRYETAIVRAEQEGRYK